jgi:fucose permease
MAPQGIGAALGMNRAGRLTDRIGGGRVVIAGLLMLMAGTVAFTQVTAHTSYWVLGASLVVRGVGLGFTMMPAMAAAYATLERSDVPRATPMLNVLQRVGGSLGTAVLAVILQRQITSELGAGGGGLNAARGISGAARSRVVEPIATAFAHTYWWAMAGTALAIVPAAVLAVTERRAARERAAAVEEWRPGAPAATEPVGVAAPGNGAHAAHDGDAAPDAAEGARAGARSISRSPLP